MDVHRRIDACVRGLCREMIDFTTELMGVASENPPGVKYAECVRVIESRLRALDLPCERVPFQPRTSGRNRTRVRTRDDRDDSGAAIVLSSVGSGTRTLYFSGHYDVVPVTTPGQCTPCSAARRCSGGAAAT